MRFLQILLFPLLFTACDKSPTSQCTSVAVFSAKSSLVIKVTGHPVEVRSLELFLPENYDSTQVTISNETGIVLTGPINTAGGRLTLRDKFSLSLGETWFQLRAEGPTGRQAAVIYTNPSRWEIYDLVNNERITANNEPLAVITSPY